MTAVSPGVFDPGETPSFRCLETGPLMQAACRRFIHVILFRLSILGFSRLDRLIIFFCTKNASYSHSVFFCALV